MPEIEDSPRCPGWLRDAFTAYLQVVIAVSKPYARTAPILEGLLRESGQDRILDLASGGGGPWPDLVQRLARTGGDVPKVTLSDIQPNLAAATRLDRLQGVSYLREPVSALDIPPSLTGVRTLFTGLHHFDPDEGRSILRSAREARVPFLAAEATHRSVPGVLVTLFIPLLVLLLMPRVRPRRALPVVLTYLPPLLPV